jgi:signal peptidase
MPGPESSVLDATDVAALERPTWVARVRRLVRFALDVLLVAALAATVFIAYGTIGNRWYHVVVIEGGSMEPTITRGDLIVVTPAPQVIEPGMILTMGVDGRVVTHRVVSVAADGTLVTRGDANNADDDWSGQRITIYGQYLFTIPAVGRFLPISNGSGAWFVDARTAAQCVEIGHWTTGAPAPIVGPAAPAGTRSRPVPTAPPTPPPGASDTRVPMEPRGR